MTMPWNYRGEQAKVYKTWYHYALCMVGLHYWHGSVYDPVADEYIHGPVLPMRETNNSATES